MMNIALWIIKIGKIFVLKTSDNLTKALTEMRSMIKMKPARNNLNLKTLSFTLLKFTGKHTIYFTKREINSYQITHV